MLPYWTLCSFIGDVIVLYCHNSDDNLAHFYSEACFRNSAVSVEYIVGIVAPGQVIFRDHLFRFSVIMPPVLHINLLNPTGHLMHQQFNIQQLYVLPALYLCVLYLSENKQRLVLLTA